MAGEGESLTNSIT